MIGTPDVAEGIVAFAERRRPVWPGTLPEREPELAP